MASISTLLTLALILTFTTLTLALTDPNPTQCGASLILMAPCMPFVQGAGLAPVDQCCNSLTELIRDTPGCVCSVLESSNSLPINRTLVLALPSLCRVDLTDTIKTCRGLSLPPSPSPQPSKHGEHNANNSASGPIHSSSKPLEKAKDQLMGKNNAEKKKLEETLFPFAFIVLMFFGSF